MRNMPFVIGDLNIPLSLKCAMSYFSVSRPSKEELKKRLSLELETNSAIFSTTKDTMLEHSSEH